MDYNNSFKKLEDYIIRENYKGYDPYDTLTSYIPFKILGKWPSAIATQIQKRNPVNIRPLLGIRKGINPKAFGLFLQAYSLLYKHSKKPEYLKRAEYFFNWLKENYSTGYSGYGWGYNFPWANPEKYMDAYVPSSVVSGFIAKGIFEYYKVSKSPEAVKILESICVFLDKDLEKVTDQSGISISYTPVMKDVCFNASLLAAEIFAKTASINLDEKLRELAVKAVDFVIDKQHADGRWNYSMNVALTEEQSQIDFHQGYVLESIYEISRVLDIKNPQWEYALSNGLKFYIEKQFHTEGWSFWRLPKIYPVEIHNQSQGIITLLKLKAYHPKANDFAREIAEWTTKNMQGKDGHFYYQKFETHTHKISYMRWSQAWMFLALTNLTLDKNE
jgi:hypothetical protein